MDREADWRTSMFWLATQLSAMGLRTQELILRGASKERFLFGPEHDQPCS
jgi:hypothetical protein